MHDPCVSIVPRSDSSRLTGNQVTSLTSLQMLSENRLVCQEAVYSPFQIGLSFVCLGTPSIALRRILPSPLLSTRLVGAARGWLQVDHGSLPHNTTWEEGNLCG